MQDYFTNATLDLDWTQNYNTAKIPYLMYCPKTVLKVGLKMAPKAG